MVYCEECNKQANQHCKICQLKYFKDGFSENKRIDNFIQEMQLKITSDTMFEWIPYNQFDNIKEIGKNGFVTIYSAIWKDGSLKYNNDKEKYERIPNKEVALKLLHNSQNITNTFLNEVCIYDTNIM